ncbi:MAG: DinB family protein [Planctomycetota bacterium]
MSEAVRLIREMHDHRLWSRDALLASARTLSAEAMDTPFEMGQSTLLRTIAHLYGAEAVWIDALEGHAATGVDDESLPDLASVEAAWPAIDARWAAYLKALTEERLADRIERDSKVLGRRYTILARDVLVHVCTHHLYTLAQASNMLRRLGTDVPQTGTASWAMDLRESGPSA